MNLQLDDFDEDYIRSATVKTCPHCGVEIQLSALVVGRDGVWRFGAGEGTESAQPTAFRRYDENTDALDFDIDYNNAETAAIHALANQNAQVDINLLRRMSLWKLDRILDVPSETIKRLQAIATDPHLHTGSAEVRALIEKLVECAGVGVPMASTILKFIRPDVFPIIDVRAYRALYGRKLYWRQGAVERNIDLYLSYASDVRRISKSTGRPLRDVDEQLYCFDLKHNGRI